MAAKNGVTNQTAAANAGGDAVTAVVSALPVPLENLQLPAHLDGSQGSNRGLPVGMMIRAKNDVEAVKAWLARYFAQRTTFDSYRKEAERLLLWAVLEAKKPLSSLSHEDLLAYQYFLLNPQPASRWQMASGHKAGRQHPDWRPFVGALSPSSQKQAIVILNGLFSWLVNARYLAGNPLALSKQRKQRPAPRITRLLDEELWQAVKTTIHQLPQASSREQAHYVRVRWLFSLLYLCGLRISEVIENTMGNFFYRRTKEGVDCWWLEITGKGNKTRLIPATSELMQELGNYRQHLGLAPYPLPGEQTPLLLPIGGKAKPLTRSAVHLIIKEIFNRTAEELSRLGGREAARAEHIRAASAHWLRHTAATEMASNAMDLHLVRDNLGHESIATTSRYLHSVDDLRHAETEQKHRLNW